MVNRLILRARWSGLNLAALIVLEVFALFLR